MNNEIEKPGEKYPVLGNEQTSYEISLLMDCFYVQFIAFSETFIKRFCHDDVIESREEIYKSRHILLRSLLGKLQSDYKDLEIPTNDK